MKRQGEEFIIKNKDRNMLNYNMLRVREEGIDKKKKSRPFTRDIFNRELAKNKNPIKEGPIKINNLERHMPKGSPEINFINYNRNLINKNVKIKLNVNGLNQENKNKKRNNTGNPNRIIINKNPMLDKFHENIPKKENENRAGIHLYDFQNPLKKDVEEDKKEFNLLSQSLKKGTFNQKKNKITFYNLLEAHANEKKKMENLPQIENKIMNVNNANNKIHFNPHHFVEEKNKFMPLQQGNEKLRLIDKKSNNPIKNKKLGSADEKKKINICKNNYNINNIFLVNINNEKNKRNGGSRGIKLRLLPGCGNNKFKLKGKSNNDYCNNYMNNINIINNNDKNMKDNYHNKGLNRYDNNYNLERNNFINLDKKIDINRQLIKIHKVPAKKDENQKQNEPQKEPQKEQEKEKKNFIIEFCSKEDMNTQFNDKMEDYTLIKSPLITILGHELFLFCVFDGHGGDKVSKYLKDNFSSSLENYIKKNLNVGINFSQILSKFFEEFDKEILKNEFSEEMGSTGVVVVIDKPKEKLYCANIGDSRCYLVDDERSVLFTKIHDSKNEQEKDRVQKAGGMFFQNRFFGTLKLTRAFGDKQFKDSGLIATPDITKSDLSKNKLKYVVLASDGVWDIVNNDLLFKIYKELEKNTADEFCEKLIKYAKENGSSDNISCIVIKLTY